MLGRAGVLPFAPLCVAVRSTGRVHMLSTWDEGVPPEIDREDLYPLSWNPLKLMASVAAISGLSQAKRIGTDGMTPPSVLALGLFGKAEVVDAGLVMDAARRIKMAEEITCLQVASAISESALSALESALAPGITERELLGVYYSHVSGMGAPVAPSESVCFATSLSGPVEYRQLASDRAVAEGDLVVLSPGALYAGYEAGLARTFVAGDAAPSAAASDLASRCAAGMDALVGACRPGVVGADLYRVWYEAGLTSAPVPFAHGLGLGAEPPVIGLGRGRDAVLEQGMVLSVQAWVAEEGVGGCLERATVVIKSDKALVLTRYRRL
jgi:Xaa-Pro aminopeptidase